MLYFRIFMHIDARELSPPLTFCCIIEYTPYVFGKSRDIISYDKIERQIRSRVMEKVIWTALYDCQTLKVKSF